MPACLMLEISIYHARLNFVSDIKNRNSKWIKVVVLDVTMKLFLHFLIKIRKLL